MRPLLQEPHDDYRFFWTTQNRATLGELLGEGWERNGIQVSSPRAIAPWLRDLDLYFCPTGVLYPRPVPIASVVMVPDIQEQYFPRFFSLREQWSRLYHHGASVGQADRVLTLSEFCREGIATFHSIPASKIVVTSLVAADDPAAATGGNTAVLPAGLPERFVLYPANFWLHKNHDQLFRAFAVIRDRYQTRLRCVLTGTPVAYGFDVASALSHHRLTDQVLVLGYQPDDVMAALYRAATALVFPSLFEGFGLPLVEAMTSGCPIVCARSASIPEVAGDAGAYFDAHDPADIAAVLVRVWTDADLRAALVEKGRARARRFSLDAMTRSHRQAFAEAREDFAHRQHEWTGGRDLQHLLKTGLQVLRSRLQSPRSPASGHRQVPPPVRS